MHETFRHQKNYGAQRENPYHIVKVQIQEHENVFRRRKKDCQKYYQPFGKELGSFYGHIVHLNAGNSRTCDYRYVQRQMAKELHQHKPQNARHSDEKYQQSLCYFTHTLLLVLFRIILHFYPHFRYPRPLRIFWLFSEKSLCLCGTLPRCSPATVCP